MKTLSVGIVEVEAVGVISVGSTDRIGTDLEVEEVIV